MPTSSDNQVPSKPEPDNVQLWSELTATLPVEPVEELAEWLDADLSDLVEELKEFVTPNSLKKSLRR